MSSTHKSTNLILRTVEVLEKLDALDHGNSEARYLRMLVKLAKIAGEYHTGQLQAAIMTVEAEIDRIDSILKDN